MPTNQKRFSIAAGFLPANAASSAGTLALSAAATWLAFGVVPDQTKTLSKVKIYCTAVTGTLTALSCDVYSDTAGTGPNASLQSSTTVTTLPTTGTAPMWVEFTGFSQSLTASTQYWLVFKNTTATPASNFPTYSFGFANTGVNYAGGDGVAFGWHKRATTNSGTSWATGAVAATIGVRVEYSDGSFDGTPFQAMQNPVASTGGVYSTRESGVLVTTPANAVWNVRGVCMYPGKSGTPTGFLRYRLYNGTTLLATTGAAPAAASVTAAGAYLPLYFASDQIVLPSTSLRIVAAETAQADTSTNIYRNTEYVIENDANSKALMPWSAQKTYFDGSSWTQTDTILIPFALLFDSDGEFAANRQLAGGMNGGLNG